MNKIRRECVTIRGGNQPKTSLVDDRSPKVNKKVVALNKLNSLYATSFQIVDSIILTDAKEYYDLSGRANILVLEAKRLFLDACKAAKNNIKLETLSVDPYHTAFKSMSMIIEKILKTETASEQDANILLYIAKCLYDICSMNDEDYEAASLYEYLNYFIDKFRKER